MMTVSNGVLTLSRGSKEAEEFTLLSRSIMMMPDNLLESYRNELVKLGFMNSAQQMMMYAIDYKIGDIKNVEWID